jgi:hypothetical protein
MQTIRKSLGILTVAALAVLAQDRPRIASITAVPSEPIPPGKCTYSTSGYLELKDGKTKDFSDAEFGQMILPALRDGYVLTIYPPTKRGIFVNSECRSANKPTASVSKLP